MKIVMQWFPSVVYNYEEFWAGFSFHILIKQTFDDVERKEKPKEDAFEFKKRIVLDQEKSKQSLAEIYEQEFVKQQQVSLLIS